MINQIRRRAAFCVLALAAMLQPVAATAQEAAAAGGASGEAPSANLSLSARAPAKRAAWQERMTLGPGDVLTFALYDTTNAAPREVWQNVVIGPDGRVSYLQARDIQAAGLTVDELRTNVNAALDKAGVGYAPFSMVTPVTVTSKKYFVLGAVVNKGVFPLDRPMTMIEAIAHAGGLETGVFERNTVEMADLSHSFLVRQGDKPGEWKRLSIDFEKLFQQGDLSQNVPLEPNDYLYFASSGANEVYVFGEVAVPGAVPFTQSSSIIGAVTTRGGFTYRAYRSRVLVIRGSLDHPETFIVDAADILKGKAGNFRLKPRDIVYVAEKPWQKLEDLLDEATRDFITSVAVTYTGAKVGPFIDPIVH